ncbi:hypothetical protein BM477_00495 [Boudabousia marimammalium]|uniref:L-2-amino-thiazoline-4-carboxylic acid hydrolase n=1 Tax=Boudabousia marimammalium TaxID=156892 RepID=A0A1Q5PSX3_9ACTO|nr:hypothetical protein BM477_00495 [Boudabousia marimammalium]
MKYQAKHWLFLAPFVKRALKKRYDAADVKLIMGGAKDEYKKLLEQADNIGEKNPMADNLYFSLLFFSFMKASDGKIGPQELRQLMRDTLSDPILLKLMGNGDFNDPKQLAKFGKKMHDNSDWAEEHREEYPETWKFNFDDSHQDGVYYYFTKCPIAKFFNDQGMGDLAPIFCELDYLTVKTRRAQLLREKTLAQGDDMCDFWIVGDQVQDPK